MASPGVAARVGQVVWRVLKEAGRVALPDNPQDVKDILETFGKLAKIWMEKGHDRDAEDPPMVPAVVVTLEVEDPQSPFARIPVIDETLFTESTKMKVAKTLLAASAIYGVHHLEMAAIHRLANENAPNFVTNVRHIVASQVAAAAMLLAGPVSPAILGQLTKVPYVLPRAIAPATSEPRFSPTGFVTVILLPFLSSLLEG